MWLNAIIIEQTDKDTDFDYKNLSFCSLIKKKFEYLRYVSQILRFFQIML